MKRNSTLDILKGICLIVVITTHFQWSAEERLRYLFPFWVDMAIPLCMLISGYLFSKSFIKKEINTISKAYSLKGGIIDRLIRYTVPFVIAYAVEVVAFDVLGYRDFPTVLDLLKEFMRGGDGSGSYYYPVLFQLVFVFPLIYFCIERRGTKGLILCCIANVVYELLQWAYGLESQTYRLLVFRYILLLSFGCYFGLGGKLNKVAAVCMFVVGILGVILNSYHGITLFFITYWTRTSCLTALFMVPMFFYLLKLDIHFPPLELIGKASYNVFLVQMVFYRFAASFFYNRISNRCILYLLFVTICLAGGIIFYYVETPITDACIKFSRKMIQYYQKRSVSKNQV